MRLLPLLSSLVVCTAAHAATTVNIFIGEPRQDIAVRFTAFPEFVRVPGYPVYYAPKARSNVFFYDGLYWVYHGDRWYASTWYSGPWGLVAPEAVPVYVLRVPVRYYRAAPAYFSGWAADRPPRWDVHWGASWAQQRPGWDRWNRDSAPAAAPLPLYQRQYTGTRYPSVEQQLVLQAQQYRYEPRDASVKQYYSQVVRPARNSASAHAPGQIKKQQQAQSAREFAPGQVKKQERDRDDDDDRGRGQGKGKDKVKDKDKGRGKD